MRKKIVWAYLLSFITPFYWLAYGADYSKLETHVGKKVIHMIHEADSVRAFAIAPLKHTMEKQIAGYPILADLGEVKGVQQSQLKKVILNDQHYAFSLKKRCRFSPKVAYLFRLGTDSVIVLFSPTCDSVEIHCAGKKETIHSDPAKSAWHKLMQTTSRRY